MGDKRAAVDVDKVEQRAQAATEGPWAWESVGEKSNEWCLGVTHPAHEGEIVETFDEATEQFVAKPDVVEGIAQSCGEGLFANARFIAAARSDVPALCAALREQDGEVARLDALEKAILSSAGDEAQREATSYALYLRKTMMPGLPDRIHDLAAAFLAGAKALADLRAAALKLGGTRCAHTRECKSHRFAHATCDCYVDDVDNLLVLAKWPGLPTNEEG